MLFSHRLRMAYYHTIIRQLCFYDSSLITFLSNVFPLGYLYLNTLICIYFYSVRNRISYSLLTLLLSVFPLGFHSRSALLSTLLSNSEVGTTYDRAGRNTQVEAKSLQYKSLAFPAGNVGLLPRGLP